MTREKFNEAVGKYNERVALAFKEYFWLLDSGWTMARATEKMDYELSTAYRDFKLLAIAE